MISNSYTCATLCARVCVRACDQVREELLCTLFPRMEPERLDQLLAFASRLEALAEETASTSSNLTLSMRQLVRICRRVSQFPDDLGPALHAACLTSFLPPPVRESFDALLQDLGIAHSGAVEAAEEDVSMVLTEDALTIDGVSMPVLVRVACALRAGSGLASSRSHCVFTISIEARTAGSTSIRRSKFHLFQALLTHVFCFCCFCGVASQCLFVYAVCVSRCCSDLRTTSWSPMCCSTTSLHTSCACGT